jgi:hypothetical protein
MEMEMKLAIQDPPREFGVGEGGAIRLKDCAQITLAPDEQVTFLTESGGEYDVVRKSWGFYATPSLNRRLERFNLRAVLVKSSTKQYFIMLVERGNEPVFQRYLEQTQQVVICWMDGSEALEQLEQAVGAK